MRKLLRHLRIHRSARVERLRQSRGARQQNVVNLRCGRVGGRREAIRSREKVGVTHVALRQRKQGVVDGAEARSASKRLRTA